jgi:hypothetical protein
MAESWNLLESPCKLDVCTKAGGKLLVMPSMVPIQNMTGYVDTVCIRELATPYMVGYLSLNTTSRRLKN